MDFLLILLVTLFSYQGACFENDNKIIKRTLEQHKEHAPICPVGETCSIDRNCRAPDGKSFCVKDIFIKECPDGQSICTLYNGLQGCSTCCDGIPECMDLSDETPCNKYKCKSTWRMIYEHDANGNYVAGNKTELKLALRRGAEVKIFRHPTYIDTPETVFILGDEVCAQSIHHVSKGSWSTFQAKAYWWFTVACTSGDLAMARWYVGGRTKPNDSQSPYGLKWFIREIEDKPMLTLPNTGREFDALKNAVKQSGYGVTVNQHDILQKEKYYHADDLEISTDGSKIVAQTVWNLMNEKFKNVAKVSTSGNWLFKNFASNGLVEFSKYKIGENTRVAVDSEIPSPSDWFFDPCWQLVFAHSSDGKTIEGSKQFLISSVMAGHRVKVMVGNRISKAAVVITNTEVVTAFLPDMLKKSNISTLEDPEGAAAKWEWMLVNTNGKVEIATYLVGEASGSVSSSSAEIRWYVDRRDWNLYLDVGPGNTVHSGSKAHIANEIKNGADLRYAWVSSGGVYTFMEPDNIGFDGTKPDFGATQLRSVLLKQNNSEYKFDVTPGSLTWFFTITTTTGVITSSKWEVGDHVSRGGETINKRVFWFLAK